MTKIPLSIPNSKMEQSIITIDIQPLPIEQPIASEAVKNQQSMAICSNSLQITILKMFEKSEKTSNQHKNGVENSMSLKKRMKG